MDAARFFPTSVEVVQVGLIGDDWAGRAVEFRCVGRMVTREDGRDVGRDGVQMSVVLPVESVPAVLEQMAEFGGRDWRVASGVGGE